LTEWHKDLVYYRLARADEALEDARVLARAKRWNACVIIGCTMHAFTLCPPIIPSAEARSAR
jgi:hypothetical protein